MLDIRHGRAALYADDLHGGATGHKAKDYRGKEAGTPGFWKFDGALVAQILATLKQTAIGEGQWTEKREMSGSVGISGINVRLNAGRVRVAAAKRAAEAGTPPA